jgi:MinD superfamily P-loop ATPase
MDIAVASGKGGTGKTTVATSLAWTAARDSLATAYLDCDVEEPDGHLFLRPAVSDRQPVWRLVPQVDPAACTHCGQCGRICQYSAIVCIGEQVLVFPELCHSCGGCVRVCPAGAISEVPVEVGRLESGRAGEVAFVHGLLNVGEAMSPPVIRAVRGARPEAELAVLDAPPGTSCPVIEAVRGCDYTVLVTEPTPFGLHDLKLTVEMVRALGQRFGVVINRAGVGDDRTNAYCRAEGIEILCEIPDDRRIAEAYSRGEVVAEALPELRETFAALLARVLSRAGAGVPDGPAEGRRA